VSGVRLEISIDDGGLGRALASAVALSDDLSAPLAASGDILVTNFQERFETERGPGGIPWKPSQAALGLAKRVSGKFNPGQTLTDTGALRESIDKAVNGNEVEVGTVATAGGDVNRKAAALQWGVAGINLVARPFIGFDDQDVADLEDLWTDVVREGFNGA
jgi:phage gpG-like protein